MLRTQDGTQTGDAAAETLEQGELRGQEKRLLWWRFPGAPSLPCEGHVWYRASLSCSEHVNLW